ncbi:MAG: hypothetical protein ACLGPM_07080 [Acidobacteriota bacterium]
MKQQANSSGIPAGGLAEGKQDAKPASEVQGRDPKVAADEEEVMRRKQAPDRKEEAAEAEKPQVAEIESVVAASRH